MPESTADACVPDPSRPPGRDRAGRTDRRFRSIGLSHDDADALVGSLVAFADRPRTRQEIEAHLAERLGAAPEPGVVRVVRLG